MPAPCLNPPSMYSEIHITAHPMSLASFDARGFLDRRYFDLSRIPHPKSVIVVSIGLGIAAALERKASTINKWMPLASRLCLRANTAQSLAIGSLGAVKRINVRILFIFPSSSCALLN